MWRRMLKNHDTRWQPQTHPWPHLVSPMHASSVPTAAHRRQSANCRAQCHRRRREPRVRRRAPTRTRVWAAASAMATAGAAGAQSESEGKTKRRQSLFRLKRKRRAPSCESSQSRVRTRAAAGLNEQMSDKRWRKTYILRQYFYRKICLSRREVSLQQ
jgi:hypothetical protein